MYNLTANLIQGAVGASFGAGAYYLLHQQVWAHAQSSASYFSLIPVKLGIRAETPSPPPVYAFEDLVNDPRVPDFWVHARLALVRAWNKPFFALNQGVEQEVAKYVNSASAASSSTNSSSQESSKILNSSSPDNQTENRSLFAMTKEERFEQFRSKLLPFLPK